MTKKGKNRTFILSLCLKPKLWLAQQRLYCHIRLKMTGECLSVLMMAVLRTVGSWFWGECDGFNNCYYVSLIISMEFRCGNSPPGQQLKYIFKKMPLRQSKILLMFFVTSFFQLHKRKWFCCPALCPAIFFPHCTHVLQQLDIKIQPSF